MSPFPFSNWIAKRRRRKALDELDRLSAARPVPGPGLDPSVTEDDAREIRGLSVYELAAELFGADEAQALLNRSDPGENDS